MFRGTMEVSNPIPYMHRRQFFQSSAIALGALGVSRLPLFAQSTIRGTASRHFTIKDIKRTTVRLSYRPAPQRAMDRELPHWRYSELCEVALSSGKSGIGETLLYYTWGATEDDDVKRAIGKNAVEIMWDDTLGAGLQMALFDAVAKTADVPLHRLFGNQVYTSTPLSWWNIDTSAADMASECKLAYDTGYMSYKTKGRPWFDIHEQLRHATTVVPESFKIDMDFNDTLRDAKRAIPMLKELEKHPQVDIYETPIPQSDVEGNRRIRDSTRVNIAMHYGNPSPRIVVERGACDGFVVGGGASRTIRAGRFAEEVDMPFWLQLVGTGITAAYSLHFGAVLSYARWPAVNCHQLYTHQLLADPIIVKDGFSKVPTGPGIGHEIDRDAVERFKVAKPAARPEPERLLETTWKDGMRMYIASNGKVNFMLTQGNLETMPFYKEGADTKLFPNDGSPRWRRLYQAAQNKPVFE
mgnify:CR=1 FL=1